MNTKQAPKPEGLRARKKRATENAIESSAVRLALELGVENVTVEAICESADISRSTFFNYFAGRDYAIVGRAIDLPEDSEAMKILDGTPDNLPLGLFRLVFVAIGHNHVNADVARMRAELLEQQPAATRLTVGSLMESSQRLIKLATRWLLANPKLAKLSSAEHEATLSVSIMHSAITSHMSEWTAGTGDTTADDADFFQTIEEYRRLIA